MSETDLVKPDVPVPKNKGGRPKGIPNKPKQKILDALQAHVFDKYGIIDWCPLKTLSEYAANPNRYSPVIDQNGKPVLDKEGNPMLVENYDPNLQVRCLETIAKYTYPQLKSVEVTPGGMGDGFSLIYNVVVEPPADDV